MSGKTLKHLFSGLSLKSNLSKNNFVLSAGNQEAFLYLVKWPNWVSNVYLVYGPNGSGKSYMAKYWTDTTGAKSLDLFNLTPKDLDKALEKYSVFSIDNFDHYFTRKYLMQNLDKHEYSSFEEVFIKIFDYIKHRKKYIFLTSSTKPNLLKLKTPDLISRISMMTSFSIEKPNENAIRTMLKKKVSENNINISSDTIDYISNNSNNSFKKADSILSLISRSFDINKRAPSFANIKKIINSESLENTINFS